MSQDNKNEPHPLAWVTLSDLLMITLIFVTAYFGYKSHEAQKESVELQRSIYQPRFVPVEISQPKEIKEKTLARVAVSNLGYVPGLYKIQIQSDSFQFESDRHGSGKEISISYVLKHGGSDDHEFYILPPSSGKLPVLASYQFVYHGDNHFKAARRFCYQLKNASEYTEVGCP